MVLTRCPTGIEGFDPLCEGGLIRNRTYLVEGTAGSGKSIFALQFLVNGARKFKEPGIFIATEERPSNIRENAANFGWDLREMEDEKKLAIIDACSAKLGLPSAEKLVDIRSLDVDALIDQVIAIQEELHAKRAVVDSTSSIAAELNDPAKFRRELLKMSTTLEMLEMTTLLTAEAHRREPGVHVTSIESFLTEGLITMHHDPNHPEFTRGIQIIKLRGSPHSQKLHPFEITPQGIAIRL